MNARAKHILILSSWYPSESHPFLGNFVERNAELLGKEYRVTVLTVEGQTVELTEIQKTQKDAFQEIRVIHPYGSKWSNRNRKFRAFKKGLKSVGSVDLLICHVLLPNGWMFLDAARRKRCPVIWVEHSSYFRTDIPNRWSPYENWMLRRMRAISSEIVAVSDSLKADMKRRVLWKSIRVIGNHVNEEWFTPQPKTRGEITQFLHVSTLDETTKNPKGILDACALLLEERSDFHLTIVSDEETAQWKKYAQSCGLENHISFVGPLDWQEIPAYFHKADAFVLFSNYETFSIVLAEALSTATPILSTPVGIAPTLPKSCCLSVEIDNIYSLRNRMLQVIKNENEFDEEALRKEGEKYSSATILNAWNQLIAEHVK